MTEPAGLIYPPHSAQLAVCQLVVPDYRIGFFEEMRRAHESFTLIAGDRAPNGVNTANTLPSWITQTSNRMLLGGRFIWQRKCLGPLLSSDVAVVEMNPRTLSSWAILILRRVMRRPSVAWGHAWSRSGRRSVRNRARLAMGRLAQVTVVYTETEAESLREIVPRRRVAVAPNAILRRSDIEPAPVPGGKAPQSFCYVGRLVSAKKPDLLLEAWALAAPTLPQDSELHIVGDGPLRPHLEEAAKALDDPSRVIFHGPVHGRSALEPIYADCVASVSPGYAGLNITLSLSFGVPLIVADDEPHAPEIEALDPVANCMFFRAGDAATLADTLLAASERFSVDVASIREQIAWRCRDRYSFEMMACGFNDAIGMATGEATRRRG